MEGEAAAARLDARAPVDVEQLHLLEHGRRPRARRVRSTSRRGDVVVDHEGEVDVGRRVAADGAVGGRAAGGVAEEDAQVELDPADGAVEAVGGEDAGVDLADGAEDDVARHQLGGAGGVEAGPGGGPESDLVEAEALGQAPATCGRPRPRRGRPGPRPGARARGAGGRRRARGQEDVADLEQGDVGPAVVGVGDHGLEQPGQQRRAQDRLLRRQRVLDLDGLGRQAGPGEVVGGQERRGPRLRQPGADEDVRHQPPVALVGVEEARRWPPAAGCGGCGCSRGGGPPPR